MKLSNFDKNMSAISFAEAGEFETARQILSPKNTSEKGHSPMQKGASHSPKAKPYLPAVGFGLVSLSLYVILLMNEQLVTDTFTKGSWYTVLPVGGALIFSFIHGAFASNLLSILGIEAKK